MTHSRLASPRATRDVLQAHDLRTRKALGQHFLIDDNVVGRILALADLDSSAVVLEVGPGIGTLTVALCEHAGAVVAVERDDRLQGLLGDLARECGNLTIVHDDAVTVPIEALTTPQGFPTALVANLPYGVAATVVLRLFQEATWLRTAVVMVQSEVADRMTAAPGSKSYGAYTVKLNLLATSVGRFPVSRGCFMPPPRVDSAVVRFDRMERPESAELLEAASRAADAAFCQRRKTLRNSLRAGLEAIPETLDRALDAARIDGGRRAETLDVQEYLALGRQLREHGLLP